MEPRRLRERLLATLSDERRFEGFRRRLHEFAGLDPEALRSLVRHLGEGEPAALASSGVRALPCAVSPAGRSGLLVCVSPGARFISMSRAGEGFVLAGSGAEAEGAAWLPGDRREVRGDAVVLAQGEEPLVFLWSPRERHDRVS